jgi:hypothetical protein
MRAYRRLAENFAGSVGKTGESVFPTAGESVRVPVQLSRSWGNLFTMPVMTLTGPGALMPLNHHQGLSCLKTPTRGKPGRKDVGELVGKLYHLMNSESWQSTIPNPEFHDPSRYQITIYQ